MGLNRRQLDALLDELDSRDGGHSTQKRAHERKPYRHENLELQVQHPDGSWSTVTVTGRNISQGGMSVLHGAFVYPGSACKILFPTTAPGSSRSVLVEGKVVRCRHIYKMLHEIGIVFNRSIETRGVRVGVGDLDAATPAVQPDLLRGAILYLDPSPSDRSAVKRLLNQTPLTLHAASNVADARLALTHGCDLVLCDVTLLQETWDAIREVVKAGGRLSPIIAVTSDNSPATQAIIRKVRCSGVLPKPITKDSLTRAIGGFLPPIPHAPSVAHASQTDTTPTPEAKPEAALNELDQHLTKLRDAVERRDAMTAAMLCLRIKTGAKDHLSSLAEAAAESLASSMDVNASLTSIQALIDECQRAANPA